MTKDVQGVWELPAVILLPPLYRADRPDLPDSAAAMADRARPRLPAGFQLGRDQPLLRRRVGDLPRPVRPDTARSGGTLSRGTVWTLVTFSVLVKET